MTQHRQAIARISRRKMAKLSGSNPSSEAKIQKIKRKYEFPSHNNRILVWIKENMPELTHVDSLAKHFKADLADRFISPTMFTRWLNNKSGITLDELYEIAYMLGANIHDLI